MSPSWRRILISAGFAAGVAIVALLAIIAYALLSDEGGGSPPQVAQPAQTATPRPSPTATLRPTPTAPLSTATPEPTAEPTSGPTGQPPPAPATSTVLGLPIIPGRTYVGSTSEGYPVAFWLSADGRKLESYKEEGELVTVSFLIQVGRPEGYPWSVSIWWPDHIPPADVAISEAVKALNDPTALVYGIAEEMPISDGRFEESGDRVLSGSIQGGLASGQFGGAMWVMEMGEPIEYPLTPVTWSASLR